MKPEKPIKAAKKLNKNQQKLKELIRENYLTVEEITLINSFYFVFLLGQT